MKQTSKNYIWKPLGIFFFILQSISLICFGRFLGILTNAMIENDLSSIYKIIGILVLAVSGEFLFGILAWKIAYKSNSCWAENIKNRLFDKELLEKRGEKFDITSFTTKIDQVVNQYKINMWMIVINVSLFVFSLIAVFTIDYIMLIIAITMSLIPMLVPSLFEKKNAAVTKNHLAEQEKYLNKISDRIKGRLEIQRYLATNEYKKEERVLNERVEKAVVHKRFTLEVTSSLINFIGSFSFLGVFIVGAILTVNGRINAGDVISVVQLMNYMVAPIVTVAMSINKMKAIKPIKVELEALAEETKINNNEKLSTIKDVKGKNISVKSLSFSYDDDKPVIVNFNKKFQAGKNYLIKGESGKGKSTLAKILAGELEANSGTIYIDDNNLVDINRFEEIIYVDQQPYLFEDSIYQNIDMKRHANDAAIKNLMSKVSLDSLNPYTIVNDEAGISGGQKLRIGLARALLNQAPIYIFDEPTASLDAGLASQILKEITNLKSTVLVISHTESEKNIQLFDEVIEL